MTTRPYSRTSSFVLALIGSALSGTIAAFIVLMIYFASFQLAAAGTPAADDAPARLQRPAQADRCRLG